MRFDRRRNTVHQAGAEYRPPPSIAQRGSDTVAKSQCRCPERALLVREHRLVGDRCESLAAD
ncbi:MAG: hypothetical protein WD229_05410 [Pirellulales bacterium]